MDVLQLIQTLGFPIASVVACGFFIYKLVTRDKDEAAERESRLLDVNKDTNDALRSVADTIHETNLLNKELSNTNRLLVEKVEGNLNDIDSNIKLVLTKLNNKE